MHMIEKSLLLNCTWTMSRYDLPFDDFCLFFSVVACRKPNMQMITVNDRSNYGVLLRHC